MKQIDLAKAIISRSFRDSEETRAFLFAYRKQLSCVQLLETWDQLEGDAKNRKDDRYSNYFHFLYTWISLFWFSDFDRMMRVRLMERFNSFPNRGNEFKLLIIKLYHNRNRGKEILVSHQLPERSISDILSPSKLKVFSNNLIRMDLSSSLRHSARSTPNIFSSVYSKPSDGSTTFNNRDSTESGDNRSQTSNEESSLEVISKASKSNMEEESFSTFQKPETKSITILPDFIKWTPREIASSLTAQFFCAFLKLQPLDFLIKNGWGGVQQKSFTALDEMISLFNKVSGWTVTEILNQGTPSGQLYILEKMIFVAQKCESLGNFDGALAILSGLNNFGIQRLKPLWDGLSDRPHTAFTNLDTLYSPVNNFRSYHEALNSRKGPMIPYVGIILRDFTFMAENDSLSGGSKSSSSSTADVNLSLGRIFWQKWQWIQNIQKETFRLSVPPGLVDFISGINVIENDDDIYSRSLAASPGGFTEMQRHNSQSSSSTIKTEDTYNQNQEAANASRLRSASIGSRESRTSTHSHHVAEGGLQIKMLALSPSSSSSKVGNNGEESPRGINPKKLKSKKTLRHLRTCTVPRGYAVPFTMVDKIVEGIYGESQRSTEKGTLSLGENRCCVMRAASLGSDLYWSLQIFNNSEGDESSQQKNSLAVMKVLREIGNIVGRSDAHQYKNNWLASNPEIAEISHYLAVAPAHFAQQGWGRWRISTLSDSFEEEIFHISFKISNCFESESWLTFKGETPHSSTQNVCHMTCGFASGYFSSILGFKTEIVEIACRATGHKTCIFVGSSSNNIEKAVSDAVTEHSISEEKQTCINLPFYFNRSSPSSTSISVHKKKDFLIQSFEKFKIQIRPRSKSTLEPNSTGEGGQFSIDQIEEKCFNHRAALYGGLYCEPTIPAVNYDHRPDIKYIFMRGESLSSSFFTYFNRLFGDENEENATKMCSKLLFEIGKSLGTSDMRYYSEEVSFSNSQEKLYFLPHVLVESGWGRLTVHQIARHVTKAGLQSVSLKLELTNSLEVAGWQSTKNRIRINSSSQDSPVCVMVSGYISGWVSEAYNIPTVCVEISCSCCRKNPGSGSCQFVVSSPSRILEDVKKGCQDLGQNSHSHLVGLEIIKMESGSLEALLQEQ
eukprot:TRINITY_DN422_c0_g1_i1.p1 TRINITY_DN422_c0_g1~~TRINITY_DN422_c0_g1_i1.p1  ORF type:complete len:1126 (+),score=391.72 TRINITY_DN422_c0_g1_i1:292-3669(+)